MACDKICGINGKMDVQAAVFPGRAVDIISHLTMVYLIKIIGHFSCDFINIQIVFTYETFAVLGKGEKFMVKISAWVPFSGAELLDSRELVSYVFTTGEFHDPYPSGCN